MTKKADHFHYFFFSILQYVAAVLVILLHCRRVFELDALHFIQKSLFSRMAVPFFLLSSAYLLKSKWNSGGIRLRSKLQQLLRSYVIWSLIYLPFFIAYLFRSGLSLKHFPLALLGGFFYTGFSYHLWYIPAAILGTSLALVFYQRLPRRVGLALCLLLFAIGAYETYSQFLVNTSIHGVAQAYFSVFLTTRNGLFFTPIFIFLGFLLADSQETPFLRKYAFPLFLSSSLLLAIEGSIVYFHQGIDKNFLFTLLPFTFCLVNLLCEKHCPNTVTSLHLKKLSVLYFYLHPLFVESFFLLLEESKWPLWKQGSLVFLLALLLTHLTSELILKLQARSAKPSV